jgi:RNA polymerase sigma-70 factor (ECF subfamily)
MTSAESTTDETAVTLTELDADSVEWLRVLGGSGTQRDAGLARLHDMLLRIAIGELHRRPQVWISGPELEDVAHQVAADALLAITAKLDQFRGESRFTTWAYKFVIFEVSAKIGRHFWRTPGVRLDPDDWERLPDRFGIEPAHLAESRELLGAVRRAVEDELTPRQRQVFVALVLHETPLDALALELGSNRNAIYKTLFDARRKMRAALVANGYLPTDTAGPR